MLRRLLPREADPEGPSSTMLPLNATFKQNFEQCGKSSRMLRDDAWAPLKLHGARICLSWHLKGACYDNCGTCNGQTLDGHTPLVGDEVRRHETFVVAAV
jgi:hypothetical protein